MHEIFGFNPVLIVPLGTLSDPNRASKAGPTDMNKDEIFRDEIPKAADFTFNKAVAQVFDNMVNRSVPFYGEMQRMIAELAADHAMPGTRIYDLGCSTGTTLLGMDTLADPAIEFVGIDDSREMLAKCRAKWEESGTCRTLHLVEADLNGHITIDNASVVVLCLTLQFVRPLFREKLLQQIIAGLQPGGVLILMEKILAEESNFNRDFIKYYYDMKRRNQYNEMEIAQKREALENVLIPYKLSENILMLHEAGFSHVEVFFKWYNFAGMIAVKKSNG